MKIAIQNQQFFFAAFYIISFILTFAAVILFSRKQRMPLRPVLLMLTTVALFTILGSRLFSISLPQWMKILSGGSIETEPGRSATGGLLFGLVGLIISQRYLGIKPAIFRLFAWLAPLSFGIQKIGCLFNGCCFGKPTGLPWGISYPIGTAAHHYQWIHGFIDENAAWSLNLHPVQIYEALGFFIVAFFVLRTEKKWKSNGGSLLFSVFLFFILRFAVGFFDDISAENMPDRTIWGLMEFQWLQVILATLSGLALWFRERFYATAFISREQVPNISKSLIYVFFVSFVIYISGRLFSVYEIIALDIIFIPAIALTAIHFLKSLAISRVRLASTAFLVFPVFLIIQTTPQDTTKQHKSISDFYKTDVKSYKRIDFGISVGNYLNEVAYNPVEGECGTTYTREDYRHELKMAGAGFSIVKSDSKLTSTMGLNFFGGINRENNLTNPAEKSFFLFGIDPYVKYDLKWFGFGAGLNIGNLRWAPAFNLSNTTFEHGTRFSIVMPQVSARVGRTDILDFKYEYGFNFPSPFPVLVNELSLGSGFGIKSGLSFRAGMGLSTSPFYFLSAEGLVSKQVGLFFRFNSENADMIGISDNVRWVTVGANYRFGFNK
jgi:prolipoprotein diacylglyceryltransferase